MVRPLVVKVTCGSEEAERLNQGFTVAATAKAVGGVGQPVFVERAGQRDPGKDRKRRRNSAAAAERLG